MGDFMRYKIDYEKRIKALLENEGKKYTYYIETMGCALNENDSMKYAGIFEEMGLKRIDDINIIFLTYYLKTKDTRKKLFGNGANISNLNQKMLQDLLFVYPSLEEQHRIVQTLDTLSEKCRRLEQVAQQTIRECDALKQSILRQAFSGEL